jgi:hypothetical protein
MGFPPGEKQGEARRKPRPAKNLGKPKIANAVAIKAFNIIKAPAASGRVVVANPGGRGVHTASPPAVAGWREPPPAALRCLPPGVLSDGNGP